MLRGHLSPQALMDCAEGAADRSAHRHLDGCPACRQQVAQLQETMRAALDVDVDVPEPSPLFWDHLSTRVRDAVAAEPRRRSWRARWDAALVGVSAKGWQRPALGLAAAGVLVALAWPPAASRVTPERGGGAAVSVAEPAVIPPVGANDDPSLALVTDLTAETDGDTLREAGLAGRRGGAEEVVPTLTNAERTELGRLLRTAIGEPGA
ncbi:MAG: hypothetical protein ABUS56_12700 [Acidobacteriota bacterium]